MAPKRIKWAGEIPKCDICKLVENRPEPNDGPFEVPTTAGPWANICSEHLNEYGENIDIGTEKVPEDVG